jgi:hypothetical protein
LILRPMCFGCGENIWFKALNVSCKTEHPILRIWSPS